MSSTQERLGLVFFNDRIYFSPQHYDDKVDIWSIGALLYKIIVGQCGFYAVRMTHHVCYNK